MSLQRQLAAIMFTDIAGYTSQMSANENLARSSVKKHDQLLKKIISQNNGVYVKGTGDGSLSYFFSAIDASKCAIEFQKSIYKEKDVNVRIGIHLGDTIFENGDIRGEGVNIASRLESLSLVGSVFISKAVNDQLINQNDFDSISLGLQSLKGVGRLMEIFALKDEYLQVPKRNKYKLNEIKIDKTDDIPSVAIVPFRNKGNDDDAFFAYGISVDLISECTRAGSIHIVSLEDIEKIENWNKLNTDDLASKLDVRYIVQGTLWKMNDLFQLSVELYDHNKSIIIWSDRWQEQWENLISIKANLSDGLINAFNTSPIFKKRIETTNVEAYKYYLEAKYTFDKRNNIEDAEIARELLLKAIEMDDNLFCAKNLLGHMYQQTGDFQNAMQVYKEILSNAEENYEKIAIGNALNNIGYMLINTGHYDEALKYQTKSLLIKEELDDTYGIGNTLNNIGIIYRCKNDYTKALEYQKKSLKTREKVLDRKGLGNTLASIGVIYRMLGDYQKAFDYQKKSLEVREKLEDSRGIGNSINNIGLIYSNCCDYNKAMDHYNRSLDIRKTLGDKRGIGNSLVTIGATLLYQADYKNALQYFHDSLLIREKLDDKKGIGRSKSYIGTVHYLKSENDEAFQYLNQSLSIQKQFGLQEEILHTSIFLFLLEKISGNTYKKNEIINLIKNVKNITYYLNYHLYLLLEDTIFIKNAINQIEERTANLESNQKAKFLNYPIPKAIVEEWEKVK